MRIVAHALRHRIAVHHQPVEHQRQIGVGDAPLPEQIVLPVAQQFSTAAISLRAASCAASDSGGNLPLLNTTSVERSARIGSRSLRSRAWIARLGAQLHVARINGVGRVDVFRYSAIAEDSES